MVAPTGERLELLAVDVEPSAWNEPIAALRAGVPPQPGPSMTSTPPTRVRWSKHYGRALGLACVDDREHALAHAPAKSYARAYLM